MNKVASAQRRGETGVQQVTVYRCEHCGRICSSGESCDPWWVSAKARMFLELRKEALEKAGWPAGPAAAVFDAETRRVLFVE
jgi:hypothetical protein